MSTVSQARGAPAPLAGYSDSLSRIGLRLLALAVIDAFAFWFLFQLIRDGVWFLALAIVVITLGINVFYLRADLYPFRWFSPGLALMILMVAYPTVFTVYTAFTNYSDGHLLPKQQTIELLEKEQFLPEGGGVYAWTAFRSDSGQFALWLKPDDGPGLLALPGEPPREVTPGVEGVGALDEDGVPESIEGYERLARRDTVAVIDELGSLEFGEAPNIVKVKSLSEATQSKQLYLYDAAQDAIVDQQSGTVYRPVEGTFTSDDGQTLKPGFQIVVGFENFQRFLGSPAFRGPFVRVFLWTVGFAIFSVLTTFALGLFLALVFNDPNLPVRKLIRSLLLVPYAIPAFITVSLWVGLLNPELGIISTTLRKLAGTAPPWFSDPWWAKVGILLINLWLGFPYMMLIATGALQSIPSDIYEAAEVDGATGWKRFWAITLPLLLVSLGPLLIASFAFNFNNFTLIRLYAQGGPPIPNTPTPAGHTDILITYTYRLAFASGRGSDFGYAAAITVVIFVVVAIIVGIQFRYTKIWEEVSENV